MQKGGRIVQTFLRAANELTFLFAKLGRKTDIQFNPQKIKRVRSRLHAQKLVDAARFSLIDYYFRMRDLYTYSVIVIQKV